MLRQYLEYKGKYPEALLFFQVGDFYEVFFEDAVTAAKILNLTLTSRDKSNPNPIPMCGVPLAVVDTYLGKLVSHGRSVAIVSQVSDASAKKGMVERKLERIVTPGVQVLGSESKPREEIYLTAVFVSNLGEEFSLAYSDVRTGKISILDGLSSEALYTQLRVIAPAEIILPRDFEGKRFDRRSNWVKEVEAISQGRSTIAFRAFERVSGERLSEVNGYVALGEVSKRAVHLLVGYVDETTVGERVQFLSIEEDSEEEALIMDAGTREHLELVSNSRDGGLHGTLLSILDRSRTAHGGRLLRQWIVRPLRAINLIEERYDALQNLIEDGRVIREQISEELKLISDLERIATRIELLAASPREMAALREALNSSTKIQTLLKSGTTVKSSLLSKHAEGLSFDTSLLKDLEVTLVDSPPASLVDGGIIRPGVNEELDRLRDIRANGKSWIAALEAKEKERTGINSLKIRFNSVFGYYIEITRANLDKVPADYIRKQTTANGERYITEALKVQEEEILNAESKESKLEKELFEALLLRVRPYSKLVRELSFALASIDVLTSIAEVSESNNYVRPILNATRDLNIVEGKHPVLLQEKGPDFIPNSLTFTEPQREILLITGPNMGGKSTYLRQAALIVIMAQMGSFVPAREVKIGIVDRIFTRIGASDNMLEGESTFMVEMREAAFILANSTNRSLLLIDELGRGTATQDGLSLAQATLEWIAEKIQARTLFATHFHELTELEGKLSGVVNLSVGSTEVEGQIIFTHAICEGPANRSYGLEVAKLAGMPSELTERAREIMTEAASQQNIGNTGTQLSIFADAPKQNTRKENVRIIEKIVEPKDYIRCKMVAQKILDANVNEMTPIAALNLLATIRQDS